MKLFLIIGIVFMHAGVGFMGFSGDSVAFFFVVSGFLFRDKGYSLWGYWLRKAKSIYPVYWFVVSATMVLRMSFATDHGLHWNTLPHLFLLQSLVPSTSDYANAFICPAWFLSCLMLCYLVAPGMHRCISRLSKQGNALLIAILYLLYVMVYVSDTGGYASWMQYFGPVTRLLQYAIGMALFQLLKDVPYRKLQPPVAGFACLAIYLMVYGSSLLIYHALLLHVAFVALFFCYESRPVNMLLGNKYIVKASPMFMFIYLAHHPVLQIAQAKSLDGYLAVFLSVVFSIIVGCIYLTLKNKIAFPK